MGSRQEIQDSDDEASDFSPIKESAPSVRPHEQPRDRALQQPAPHSASRQHAPNVHGTNSTDDSSFCRLYDEQHATFGHGGHEGDQLDAPVLLANPDPHYAPMRNQHHSPMSMSIQAPIPMAPTIIDDPVGKLAFADPRVQVLAPRKGVATGSGGTAHDDIWDVPESPRSKMATSNIPPTAGSDARPQKIVTLKYGKRKRGGLPSSPSPQQKLSGTDKHGHIQTSGSTTSPSPTRKRIRLEDGRESAGTSSGVVIPLSNDQTSPRVRRSPLRGSGKDSSGGLGYDMFMGNVSDSLIITPSALSASQKRAYRTVSVTSGPETELQESTLPPLGSVGRSSAPTIAYTTPSHYGSSNRGRGMEEPRSDFYTDRQPEAEMEIIVSQGRPVMLNVALTSFAALFARYYLYEYD
jgi:hypothetical protein